jgi:hypothetical protein
MKSAAGAASIEAFYTAFKKIYIKNGMKPL